MSIGSRNPLIAPSFELSELRSAFLMLARVRASGAISRVKKLLAAVTFHVERRAQCAVFLVVMRDSGSSKLLAQALPEIRNWSRVQLLLRQASCLEQDLLAAILEFARDQVGFNVHHALEILATFDHRPALPDLRHWLDSDDQQVSQAAFNALMKMGEGLSIQKLHALLSFPSDSICISIACRPCACLAPVPMTQRIATDRANREEQEECNHRAITGGSRGLVAHAETRPTSLSRPR